MKLQPQSVFWQIRLGLGAIILLVISLVVLALYSLSQIENTGDALVRDTVPQLQSAQFVSRELSGLNVDISQISITRNASRLSALEERIDQRFRRLTGQAALPERMVVGLVEMKASAQKSIALSRDRLELQEARDQQVAEIEAVRNRILTLTRVLVEDAEEALETALVNTQSDTGGRPERLAQIVFLNTVSIELGQTLDSIAADAAGIVSTTDVGALNELETRVAFQFREAVLQLVSIPNREDQTTLAKEVKALRDTILSDTGLVDAQRNWIVSERSLQNLDRSADVEIAKASDQLSGFLQLAETDIRNQLENIRKASAETNWTILLTGILAICLLVGVLLVVVERRIVSRLSSLSRSVRAISEGDHDHEVLVHGRDELGEMGAALNGFKENSRELMRSNAELEKFAYAASHDLSSPLQAIRGLAEMVKEDCYETMPQSNQNHLDLILRQVNRLSTLTVGLLEYSRIGKENASIRPVVFKTLVEDCLEAVEVGGRYSVEVTGNCQSARTYDAPFRQIMLNLINNSVKHNDRLSGHLVVDVSRDEGRLRVRYSDDGPGIAARHQARVFELFQTLKARDEVEGSGIGLSLIKRLVENYKGKIELVSNPPRERGTTFVFDWPLEETSPARRDG